MCNSARTSKGIGHWDILLSRMAWLGMAIGDPQNQLGTFARIALNMNMCSTLCTNWMHDCQSQPLMDSYDSDRMRRDEPRRGARQSELRRVLATHVIGDDVFWPQLMILIGKLRPHSCECGAARRGATRRGVRRTVWLVWWAYFSRRGNSNLSGHTHKIRAEIRAIRAEVGRDAKRGEEIQ